MIKDIFEDMKRH
jgi:phospholipid-transporting ATPase